ncbi:MAG: single-stranded-DNA-specific exonuclease RecJ [Deltaproteobacteria bacterium]|nr:single-stranded-DNA-specific exonuclease RecJ [Deltaproteobacteria bacterium]
MEWTIEQADPEIASKLAHELDISPLLASILISRGMNESKEGSAFLHPSLKDLPDPYLLPDLDKAVERLLQALGKGELITIYGDYDADGLTSTALLADFLQKLGANVHTYIPHRLDEGYGLHIKSVEALAEKGARLIVTVDCGVSDYEPVNRAKELGLDVIITDHHRLPDYLPNASAIVNPKRRDSRFPQADLAGVGVAFFLAGGLRKTIRDKGLISAAGLPELTSYLGLVTLGTVADMVPLTRINRILVSEGLKHLSDPVWPGLAALKQVSDLNPNHLVTARDVGFRLAPRLNATGRLDSPKPGLDLLLTRDPDRAQDLAAILDEHNTKRKQLQEQVVRQARDILDDTSDACNFIVLAHKGWHRGVLGIAASKLSEIYHKPAILLSVKDGLALGSGRSVEGFSLYEALNQCQTMLEHFGGHDQAAGLGLAEENIPELALALGEIAVREIGEEFEQPALRVAAEVGLEELNQGLILQLMRLAPFGMGNPEPILAVSKLKVLSCSIVGQNHLKLRLKRKGRILDTIGFGLGDLLPDLGPRISAAIRPLISIYRGQTTYGWQVIDIKK